MPVFRQSVRHSFLRCVCGWLSIRSLIETTSINSSVPSNANRMKSMSIRSSGSQLQNDSALFPYTPICQFDLNRSSRRRLDHRSTTNGTVAVSPEPLCNAMLMKAMGARKFDKDLMLIVFTDANRTAGILDIPEAALSVSTQL